ncbi:MAG: DUF6263 family protein [Planctomycetota bacterium]
MNRPITPQRFLLSLLALSFLSGVLHAQNGVKLQWKFNKGDKLLFEMEQAMEMKMSIAGQNIRNGNSTKTWMAWNCADVKDGIATIESTIERMSMDMITPSGPIKFDSDDKEHSPQAAAVAQSVGGLVGKTMTQTMNGRGEILTVELGKEVGEALGNLGGPQMADMVKQMSKQASLVLPEKPLSVGDSWNEVIETPSPAGNVRVTRTFTYKGMGQADRKGLHHFDVDLEMKFLGGPAGAKIDIVEQSTKGDLYFDASAGRVTDSSVLQNVKMRITTGGQQLDQSLNQTIKMKVSEGTAALNKAG